jgi:PAS domain S-box-containing protein
MMLVCLAAGRLSDSAPPRVAEWVVYLGALVGAVLAGMVFALVPDPAPLLGVSRPIELIPGTLFAVATAGFFRLGKWRTESIHFWLVCSLLISTICQLFVISRSSDVDGLFIWAHVLAVLSYLAILIGLLIDIYQLHRELDRTSDELRKSEERFALATEGSNNGMWDWDLQSNKVWYSPRFWEMLGYDGPPLPASVVESFNQHLHPDDYQHTWDAVNRHLNDGQEFDVEYRLRHRQQGYRWFRARGVALRNDQGKPVRMSGSIQDITQSKLAAKQLKESSDALQRSNDELQQFAYVASHDLQEPLRAIAGYCGLLNQYYKDQLDEDGQQFLGFAIDGAKRMQELIDSLLNLSRVRTHGKPFGPTNLNNVVQVAMKNLSMQISEADAEIQVGELPQIIGDAMQLTQLLQNLLNNAIKFRREGTRPKIEIRADVSRDDEWLVWVRDNGIGIDPKHVQRIYTVFQRLHTREAYSGTGIGLSICKRVIERHQGRIWTESEPDRGSTFFFTIPKNLSTKDPVESRSAAASGKGM